MGDTRQESSALVVLLRVEALLLICVGLSRLGRLPVIARAFSLIAAAFVVVPILLTSIAWLLGTFHFRRRSRLDETPAFLPFDPTGEEVDPRVGERARAVIDELIALGFDHPTHLAVGDSSTPAVVNCTALVHPRDGSLAKALFWVVPGGVGHMVAFVSRLADGRDLVTRNGTALAINPSLNRRLEGLHLADCDDLGRLWEIHRARAGDLPTRPVLGRSGLGGHVEETHAEEMRVMLDRGLYLHDLDRRVYRPTWRGAVVISLINAPPIPDFRRWLRRRRASRALDDLGLGN